jgi:enoyl-CoA hydratase/carnithine racemase
MAIAEEPVLVERDGELATVILNRPAKLNAMNRAMARRLADEMNALTADASVKCVLMRGSGKAFCPGADIGEFGAQRASGEEAEAFATYFHGALDAVVQCPHPVVATIRGACVGGGLQLAALCDLRIASESARFGIPVNRIGLTVDYSELAPIYRLIGEGPLLEILLEGRVFSAAEALGKGLVHRVVPDDRLDDEAMLTARRIADGAPLVNRWHKKFVRRLSDPRPISDEEMRESFLCFDTKDYLTGYQAFLGKTKPVWEGR